MRIGAIPLSGKTTYQKKHPEDVVDVDDVFEEVATKIGIETSRMKKAWRKEPEKWKEWSKAWEERIQEYENQGKIILVHAQDPKAEVLVIPENKEYIRRAEETAKQLGLTDEQMSIVRRLSAGTVQLRKHIAKEIFDSVEAAVSSLQNRKKEQVKEVEEEIDEQDQKEEKANPEGGKMAEGTPDAVGWFVKDDGQLITILPEQDQTPDQAIEEEAKDHGVDKAKVKRGKPPEDWKAAWEGQTPAEKKPEGNPAPPKVEEETKKNPTTENGAKNPPLRESVDFVQEARKVFESRK